MQNIPAKRATHKFGKPRNWDDEKDGECYALHVRAGTHGDRNLPTFTTAWRPSQEEIAKMLLGGEVEITLIGTQPPMRVDVILDAEVPEKPTITINEDAHGLS